jgi:phospholipid-translocating ATPase
VVLYHQFKYFFNFFFLIVALSQFVEKLRVGFFIAYVGPLVFVIVVTMLKEFYDDHQRAQRDFVLNNGQYTRMNMQKGISTQVASEKLNVGDIIQLR